MVKYMFLEAPNRLDFYFDLELRFIIAVSDTGKETVLQEDRQ